MSFILDALKKAEQERQEQAAASLEDAFEPTQPPRRRSVWPPLLAVALLLNLALGGWYLFSLSSREPGPSPRGIDHQPAPLEVSVARSSTATAEPRSIPAAEAVEPSSAPPPAAPQVPRAEPEARLQAKYPPVDASPAADRPMIDAEVPDKPAPSGPASLNELPASLRAELPDLKLTLHYYAPEEQDSMVRLNGRIVRTGEEFHPGLRVDEITPEGIVLDYGGYRFVDPNLRIGR